MTPAARAFCDLVGARAPIVQAPMAGSGGTALASAAMRGGAVGSLPCALLTPELVAGQVEEVRAAVAGPINLNFFCHRLEPAPDMSAWLAVLAPLYVAEGVGPPDTPAALRRPFDATMVEIVERVRPEIVSFHFGLPGRELLARVRASGALVWCSATTVEEARYLAEARVDAVIAQGEEAGGHAGWFLGRHHPQPLATLLPAIVAEVDVPVIAAGGIVDGAEAGGCLAAGAAAVQVGTAYLATPESLAGAVHRARLGQPDTGVFTTVFTGREARGQRNALIDALGPQHPAAPAFPHASSDLAPLRAVAEAAGRDDYSPLWAGAGIERVTAMPAEQLTRRLAAKIKEETA